MKKLFITLMALALIGASAAAETIMHAVNVGKGDAIVITVNGENYLVDTAKGYACGRLRQALTQLGVTQLDGVFITHVDSDHVEGLQWLAQSGITVGGWYASPYFFKYKDGKHPLQKLDLPVTWLEAGDSIPVNGGEFHVLAPLTADPDEENNNSLVIMLETDDGRLLLTGDMESPEEAELMASGFDVACHALKVANHGDSDASGWEFLSKAAPFAAVISTDSSEKPGTPAPEVLFDLERLNADAFVTQGHSAVKIVVDGENTRGEYVDWPSAPNYSVTMAVDRENELFTISNSGAEDVSLGGWYIYSAKGNELFIFPDMLLPAGAQTVVGTKSSPEGAYDVFWDEKKVVSKKSGEYIVLYDENGNAISAY